jgi:hypothetical protein
LIVFIPGSGAGWNSSFSVPNNFSDSLTAFQDKKDANPAGFTFEDSWMGGIRCSPKSRQFGGFGGGGAGCKGGGGGGGYVGKKVEANRQMNIHA